MTLFPFLADVFGVATVAEIDAAAIGRAVAAGVPETEQLDWKSVPYGSRETEELAKDVAAFANHHGGLIVIGIRDDHHNRAVEATPFTTPPATIDEQLRQVRTARVRPFLPTVTVHPIAATEEGSFFAIIEVPAGADAPYACQPESPTATTLAFPVRDGTTTRWLKQDGVARAYRDRFTSRVELADRLTANHDNGMAAVRSYMRDRNLLGNAHSLSAVGAVVSVAAVPINMGARTRGVAARREEIKFLTRWIDNNKEWHGAFVAFPPHHSYYMARPAIGRTLFTTPDATLALHHDGGGFVAQFFPYASLPHAQLVHAPPRLKPLGDQWAIVPSDKIEWSLFVAIIFLMDHAVATGAAGELELIAQLHFGDTSRAVNGGVAEREVTGMGRESFLVPDTGAFSPETQPARTTTTTEGAAGDEKFRRAAAASFELSVDIFAEFGFDEPHVFTGQGGRDEGFGRAALPASSEWLGRVFGESQPVSRPPD
ncbi:AlbA family DNA-binding domain-containing protein [Williamsia sterculiae]|uniref:Putative DNA-binding domain-containing protein n=1 Tax=Williamsia sterculiae TaxID=1344003 RepID=A0A1N7HEB7_9NOCA|nr:ATP-binding protein [Williamsia sterculiae]SIS23172.1 Putative DNA-binding domain-containing protein [Williamsia sterculiae]